MVTPVDRSPPPPAIGQATGTTTPLSSGLEAALSGLQQGLVAQATAAEDVHKPIWGRTPPRMPLNEPSAPATEKPAGAPAGSPNPSHSDSVTERERKEIKSKTKKIFDEAIKAQQENIEEQQKNLWRILKEATKEGS